MEISEKEKQIPDEFKQLAKDFSENGFITTSFDNLVNSRFFIISYLYLKHDL